MILYGKTVADKIIKQTAIYVRNSGYPPPRLSIISIGDDEASKVYVTQKMKAAAKCGIECDHYSLPSTVTTQEVIAHIHSLNNIPDINGIIVQLPIMYGLDQNAIIQAIDPKKDVDGLTYENMGKVAYGKDGLYPCTAAGIMRLLGEYGITIAGKNVVIVGRSPLVGKPLAMMMTNENATVTLCHSKTKKLASIIKKADILVVAVGDPEIIKGSMVKLGATVIDVGITRVNGNLTGDVHFYSVQPVAGAITPVPGGVGPMTVAMLMANVVNAQYKQNPR